MQAGLQFTVSRGYWGLRVQGLYIYIWLYKGLLSTSPGRGVYEHNRYLYMGLIVRNVPG